MGTISYALVVVLSFPIAVGLTGSPARPLGGDAGSGTGLSWPIADRALLAAGTAKPEMRTALLHHLSH